MKRDKKISALILALGITFITGCGGGGSDDRYVLIMHSTPSGICESSLFIDALEEEGFLGVSTKEYGYYDKSCGDYPSAKECTEHDYEGDLGDTEPADCTIKFSGLSGYGKKVGTSNLDPKRTTWAEKATNAISSSVE